MLVVLGARQRSLTLAPPGVDHWFTTFRMTKPREDNYWICHAGAQRSIFKHKIEILHYVQDDKAAREQLLDLSCWSVAKHLNHRAKEFLRYTQDGRELNVIKTFYELYLLL